ncbi:hypothetical protein BG53_13175 [Paenibacillus darwinianus]|uniref:Uncharacterized protein n=1 Tax=Paenibacillus darwinianus TaxID=1380763 RepID=A0A9W5S1S0_9BACL|nr:hypothetical protein [Paenibacillus darwinianus]EXX87043.1 hypothetical protein CH50_06065 [Paenibacillus darwinianus]EXX90583.1 hypothetical protein BG52_13120 [Paenibacillus darwinianus]EXX90609.1 hypothetical protein BG53_13175 [Paenibacillus darwinianus]
MCVLCGGFVVQEHWTEGRGSTGAASVTVGGGASRERQRDRRDRTAMANRILACYGLKLEDWNGSKYIVRDVKGSSEIVHDLGALWPAVEKLIKKTADPLDPALIGRLQQQQQQQQSGRP